MPRSIYCCDCKLEKEANRRDAGYCNACVNKRRREKRAKERIEKNILPTVFRRSPLCYDCKAPKENLKQSYCNPCRSKRSKEWALRTGRVKYNRTGLCPCGAERAPNQKRFCLACKAEDSRLYRARKGFSQADRDRYNAYYEANKEKIRARYKEDELYHLKKWSRSTTNNYIASGVLVKKPCEVCGSKRVEAHHDDYTKPMAVRWLCRKHHVEHHRKENSIKRMI